MTRTTVANHGNLSLLEDYYQRWLKDPQSVDPSWRNFFEGYELGQSFKGQTAADDAGPAPLQEAVKAVTRLVDAYREMGHHLADLDPLKLTPRPKSHEQLELAAFGLADSDLDQVFYSKLGTEQPLQPAAKLLAHPPPDVLPDDRRRVHAHPRPRRSGTGCSSGWSRSATARVRPQEEAADHLQAERRRAVREVPPQELRGPEAVLARGGRDAHPPARRGDRASRQSHGVLEIVMGMPHRGRLNVLANILHKPYGLIFSEFEGNMPETVAGDGDVKYHLGFSADHVTPGEAHGPPDADAQPQPPGGGQPGGRGPDAGQATAVPGQGPEAGRADPDPRRRGVRRPGAGGRDAQPVAASRLPHRRHHPHRGQQPDRLHDGAHRGPLDAVLHRRRQDDRGADLPRQRRGPRGGRLRRRAGDRLPPDVRPGRRHRHGLLPPARPQRGRRAGVHPAGHVREDPATGSASASCTPSNS